MPRSILATLLSVALLALAPAAAGAAPFVVTLKAPNHHPKGGTKSWHIRVGAHTTSGRPLRATAVYRFLYRGQVVSTQYPNPGHAHGGSKPYRFKGSYRDTILWPPRAAGYRLTFRVSVTVRGKGTVSRDWWVRVRR